LRYSGGPSLRRARDVRLSEKEESVGPGGCQSGRGRFENGPCLFASAGGGIGHRGQTSQKRGRRGIDGHHRRSPRQERLDGGRFDRDRRNANQGGGVAEEEGREERLCLRFPRDFERPGCSTAEKIHY